MDEYVFRLASPNLASYFWVAVCTLGAAWPLVMWRLLPLARRAVRERQVGVAVAACAISVCPLLLTPTVEARLYEQSLAIRIGPDEVVESSLLGTHRIVLDRELSVKREGDTVVVSDDQDRITLPAGRRWRLQYPFMSTDELVAEILSRSDGTHVISPSRRLPRNRRDAGIAPSRRSPTDRRDAQTMGGP